MPRKGRVRVKTRPDIPERRTRSYRDWEGERPLSPGKKGWESKKTTGKKKETRQSHKEQDKWAGVTDPTRNIFEKSIRLENLTERKKKKRLTKRNVERPFLQLREIKSADRARALTVRKTPKRHRKTAKGKEIPQRKGVFGGEKKRIKQKKNKGTTQNN